jgi:hypothetical protein
VRGERLIRSRDASPGSCQTFSHSYLELVDGEIGRDVAVAHENFLIRVNF